MDELWLVQHYVIVDIHNLLKNSSQYQEKKEVPALSTNNSSFISANVACVIFGKGIWKITCITELVTTEQIVDFWVLPKGK